MHKKDLSIIIVNWNTGKLLEECVASIYATVKRYSFEIIVVDNASTKDGADHIVDLFPEIVLIKNRENVGFAAANNQAMRTCSGGYVTLLNPDTVLLAGAFDLMADYLDKNPSVWALGPRLLNSDGTNQPSTAGRFPTLRTIFNEASGLSKLFSNVPSMGGLYIRNDIDEVSDVDWVSGACIMVRSEVLKRVGMLNEDFFMYFEDQEWCYRIKQAGYEVVFFPGARIIHHGNRSILQQEEEILYRNKITFKEFIKHFNGAMAARAAHKIHIAGLYLRYLAAVTKHTLNRNGDSARRLAIIKRCLRLR